MSKLSGSRSGKCEDDVLMMEVVCACETSVYFNGVISYTWVVHKISSGGDFFPVFIMSHKILHVQISIKLPAKRRFSLLVAITVETIFFWSQRRTNIFVLELKKPGFKYRNLLSEQPCNTRQNNSQRPFFN